MKIFVLLVFLLVLSQSQTLDPTKVASIFQDYFKKDYLDGNSTTNVVVIVVQNNSILYQAGFGNINYFSGAPVVPDPMNNLYPLASITKTFTGTCVLQLVIDNFFNFID